MTTSHALILVIGALPLVMFLVALPSLVSAPRARMAEDKLHAARRPQPKCGMQG